MRALINQQPTTPPYTPKTAVGVYHVIDLYTNCVFFGKICDFSKGYTPIHPHYTPTAYFGGVQTL